MAQLLENAERKSFDFAMALLYLKQGKPVMRTVWDRHPSTPSSADFLMLVPGSVITVDPDRPLGEAMPWNTGEEFKYTAHIDLVRPSTRYIGVWQPTNADLLAVDWLVWV